MGGIGIEKLIFLGSSCIYPKESPQPIKEESILTGPLEPTNEAYAIAKIAGLKLVESYRMQYGHTWISLMPTNLFGLGDNYDLETSHVLPALIRKFHQAKTNSHESVTLWGSGAPLREFLCSDALALSVLRAVEMMPEFPLINIGSGHEVTIEALAAKVARLVGFSGQILWDSSKPDGTLRKSLDLSLSKDLGLFVESNFDADLQIAYQDFLDSKWNE